MAAAARMAVFPNSEKVRLGPIGKDYPVQRLFHGVHRSQPVASEHAVAKLSIPISIVSNIGCWRKSITGKVHGPSSTDPFPFQTIQFPLGIQKEGTLTKSGLMGTVQKDIGPLVVLVHCSAIKQIRWRIEIRNH